MRNSRNTFQSNCIHETNRRTERRSDTREVHLSHRLSAKKKEKEKVNERILLNKYEFKLIPLSDLNSYMYILDNLVPPRHCRCTMRDETETSVPTKSCGNNSDVF